MLKMPKVSKKSNVNAENVEPAAGDGDGGDKDKEDKDAKAKKKVLSQKEIHEFIAQVEVNSCLWDHQDKEYTNKFLRDKAKLEIGTRFGISIHDVEVKTRSLRNNFNNEKSRMKNSLKSGAAAADVYKTSWEYFDELQFLNKVDDSACRRIDNLSVCFLFLRLFFDCFHVFMDLYYCLSSL